MTRCTVISEDVHLLQDYSTWRNLRLERIIIIFDKNMQEVILCVCVCVCSFVCFLFSASVLSLSQRCHSWGCGFASCLFNISPFMPWYRVEIWTQAHTLTRSRFNGSCVFLISSHIRQEIKSVPLQSHQVDPHSVLYTHCLFFSHGFSPPTPMLLMLIINISAYNYAT